MRGIQELRDFTSNHFPNKTPEQQTRRVLAFQFKWLEKHAGDIKDTRGQFPTTEVSSLVEYRETLS